MTILLCVVDSIRPVMDKATNTRDSYDTEMLSEHHSLPIRASSAHLRPSADADPLPAIGIIFRVVSGALIIGSMRIRMHSSKVSWLLAAAAAPLSHSLAPVPPVCLGSGFSSSSSSPFSRRAFSPRSIRGGTRAPPAAAAAVPDDPEDPYVWLEAVDAPESLAFARAANEACLAALGDPAAPTAATATYARILAALESEDRIPHATQHGRDAAGRAVVYNFCLFGK
jgi:hypothetical protein